MLGLMRCSQSLHRNAGWLSVVGPNLGSSHIVLSSGTKSLFSVGSGVPILDGDPTTPTLLPDSFGPVGGEGGGGPIGNLVCPGVAGVLTRRSSSQLVF